MLGIFNLYVSVYLQSTVSGRCQYVVLGWPAEGLCLSRRGALKAIVGRFCVGSAHGSLCMLQTRNADNLRTSLQRAGTVVPLQVLEDGGSMSHVMYRRLRRVRCLNRWASLKP